LRLFAHRLRIGLGFGFGHWVRAVINDRWLRFGGRLRVMRLRCVIHHWIE